MALPTRPMPTDTEVAVLQSITDYPCVSLLLTTRPGPTMHPADAAALDALLASARARISAEPDPVRAQAPLPALEALVARAKREPTTAALAVYASPHHRALVHLPVPVLDRAVIDPTFATRDLVRALDRAPRHLVLVLAADEARLFVGGHGRALAPVGDGWPLHATEPVRHRRDPDAFLRTVDRALGAHRKAFPSPLVVVGGRPLVSAFLKVARNTDRLAGTVPGVVTKAPLAELQGRVRPVLEAYLRSREADALAALDAATGAGRTLSGVANAWLGVRAARPEMLAVEEHLYFPARITSDGDLVPAGDVTSPDVIDDAVDELIEAVMQRGGWVAIVADGALADHGGAALTLRAR